MRLKSLHILLPEHIEGILWKENKVEYKLFLGTVIKTNSHKREVLSYFIHCILGCSGGNKH